ncbi:MAG: lipoprotein LipL31 [Leptospiraceae bacterium]|nr:lipoprotein LipL31 [Leptospiraceae bacterium]MCP5503014.1 lipoprotein LipL31 [Leptospiraceae bacterium]
MKFVILILLSSLSFFYLSCQQKEDDSQVIETLDGHKISVKSFNAAYETAIESLSRMQNIEKKNLLEFISKDVNEVPNEFKALNQQFQKKNFYDNYRQMMMIKIVADKNGFTSRPDIKKILKQVEMQTISSLYIQEQVEKKIKITDEQAMSECEKLRAQNKAFASMTVDKCVMIGRGYLKRAESEKILPRIIERVKESVSIKHNEKFDLEEYMKSSGEKKEEKKEGSEVKQPEPKK